MWNTQFLSVFFLSFSLFLFYNNFILMLTFCIDDINTICQHITRINVTRKSL